MDCSRPKINPRNTAEAAAAKAAALAAAAAEAAERFRRVAAMAPWIVRASPGLAFLGCLPPVEDCQVEHLDGLLAYAARHAQAGRLRGEIIHDALSLNRGPGRVSPFAMGGLCDQVHGLLDLLGGAS